MVLILSCLWDNSGVLMELGGDTLQEKTNSNTEKSMFFFKIIIVLLLFVVGSALWAGITSKREK